MMMLGGPMSANSDLEWLRAEMRWIEAILMNDVPLIGVCLGAQLIARVLGAAVTTHADAMVEMGIYRIEPTFAGTKLLNWPTHVYQWHRETFSLVDGMELLAQGEIFERQAFRYSRCVYGLQFHPEASLDLVRHWTNRGSDRLTLKGAQKKEHQIALAEHHLPASNVLIEDLLRQLIQ